jgi:chlorite dismutase
MSCVLLSNRSDGMNWYPVMSLQKYSPDVQQKTAYRFVKYTFFKVDPASRRLPPKDKESLRQQFLQSLIERGDRIQPRSYSLVGTRADVDFMLWTITESLELLQGFHSGLLKTELGKYLSTPYSYLAMLRPSEYFGRHTEREPVGSKYLFVYPFTKKREWYSLPFDERRRIMKDHVQAGQKYPSVTIHTSYSFGIDDYEFILSFETDHPEDFVNLVMDLRATEASRYTALETPIFTCLNVEPGKMLDLFGL